MKVLGIAAHPDDLDFGASGTFAKWASEGAECYYLICTNGCKGSDDPDMTESKLITLRRAEQIAAGKVLGIKGVFFLGHNDTELVSDIALKKEIVRYIRRLKPDIVVTTDPTFVYSKDGFINHTDHRAAGQAAIDAVFPLARDRLTFKELEKEGLKPHKVKQLYLLNFSSGDTIVDISKTIKLKLAALKCHKSQISGDVDKWISKRAHIIGKRKGYKFAEAFIRINLWR